MVILFLYCLQFSAEHRETEAKTEVI